MNTPFCFQGSEKMKKVRMNSYAKINLSLDVKGQRSDGYHEVETFMQQIDFCDEVLVRWYSFDDRQKELKGKDISEEIDVEVSTNKPYLPKDERNLAYRAARLMAEKFSEGHLGGKIRIDIKKRIPVAAGLAGGSANAASVILALNKLWGLRLSVAKMMNLGLELGADVPFCIMGQARANLCLGGKINKDPMAANAAVGKGIGADLAPAKSVRGYVLLAKPPISISTKEVYQNIDAEIEKAAENGKKIHHADAELIAAAIKEGNYGDLSVEMGNILELYTLKRYPEVAILRNEMANCYNPIKVMMSGSGPTLFALYTDYHIAYNAWEKVEAKNPATYLVETI